MDKKEQYFKPQYPNKFKTMTVRDVVVLNEQTIEFMFVGGAHQIGDENDAFYIPGKQFVLIRIILSKAMRNTLDRARPKKQYHNAIKDIIVFDELENCYSYYTDYNEKMISYTNGKHSFFIDAMLVQEAIRISDDYSTRANLINEILIKQAPYSSYNLNLNDMSTEGRFAILKGVDYKDSSPDCLRGEIISLWKKNKEIDLSQSKERRKLKYSPKLKYSYVPIEEIDMKSMLNTPMHNLVACVEWHGMPSRWMSCIPAYCLRHYSDNNS